MFQSLLVRVQLRTYSRAIQPGRRKIKTAACNSRDPITTITRPQAANHILFNPLPPAPARSLLLPPPTPSYGSPPPCPPLTTRPPPPSAKGEKEPRGLRILKASIERAKNGEFYKRRGEGISLLPLSVVSSWPIISLWHVSPTAVAVNSPGINCNCLVCSTLACLAALPGGKRNRQYNPCNYNPHRHTIAPAWQCRCQGCKQCGHENHRRDMCITTGRHTPWRGETQGWSRGRRG